MDSNNGSSTTERNSKNGSDNSSTGTQLDGGFGWMIVTASFVVHLISDGIIFSFGTFFIEFTKHFNQTESTTAWIGSTLAAMPLLGGPPAAYFTDTYGCGKVTIVGGILATVGFLLSSISTSVFYLIITFGLITGCGLSLVYIAGVDIIAHYFDKRRSFATGIAVCGGGIGTFIYAPLIQSFLQVYGWQMATVMLAGNFLIICLCGYFFKELNKEPKGHEQEMETTSSDNENDNKSISSISYPPSSEHHRHQSSRDDNCPWTPPWEERIPRCKSTSFLPALFVQQQEDDKQEMELKRFYSYNQNLAECCGSGGGGLVVGQQDLCKSHDEICYTEGGSSNPPAARALIIRKVSGWISAIRMSVWAAVSNRQFLLFLISNFILYAWYDVPYMYIQTTATQNGHSEAVGSYFISAIGMASVFGNVILGYLGDQPWVKPTSVYGVCTIICGVSTILMPYAMQFHYVAVILANSVFGASIAANGALTTAILVQTVSLEKFAFAYGFLMFIQGIGNLVGPPIAGIISDWLGNNTLSYVVAGVGIIISGFFLFAPAYRTEPAPGPADLPEEENAEDNPRTDANPAEEHNAAVDVEEA